MARGFGSPQDGDRFANAAQTIRNNLTLPLQQVLNIQEQRNPSPEEIAEESRELLLSFTHHEVQNEKSTELDQTFHAFVGQDSQNDELSECSANQPSIPFVSHSGISHSSSGAQAERDDILVAQSAEISRPSSPYGHRTLIGAQIGQSLRKIADEFAKSKKRDDLRKQADSVDLGEIEKNTFYEMLRNLFYDGSNIPERIVVLFFFCSDVIIRTCRLNKSDLFRQLLTWALSYINDVVNELGGWEKVLGVVGNFIWSTCKVICLLSISLAAWAYFKKNR